MASKSALSLALKDDSEAQLARRRPSIRLPDNPLPESIPSLPDPPPVEYCRPGFGRVHSEADLRSYDPVTGRLLARKASHFAQDELVEPTRSPFSSTFGRVTSSPHRQNHSPPPQSVIHTVTQDPVPNVLGPSSLKTSSAWPVSFNRKRQSRRLTTSASPATTFLSRYACEESLPELDEDGQEVGDYMLGRQIGFGGFSVIKEAFCLRPGEDQKAVKIVRKNLVSKDEAENERLQTRFEHEVEIWRRLGHAHILPLLEVFENAFATYCFTRLNTGGTLHDKLKLHRRGLVSAQAQRYIGQLASALRYLHEDERIVHRDIKLENCLVTNDDNLLLCDFGLAEFLETGAAYEGTPSGSLQYAAPEVILNSHGFLHPAPDIWAFGVLAYALLSGSLPFQHIFQPRVQMMILAGEYDLDPIKQVSSSLAEMVRGCLDMCWEDRLTIAQVLQCECVAQSPI